MAGKGATGIGRSFDDHEEATAAILVQLRTVLGDVAKCVLGPELLPSSSLDPGETIVWMIADALESWEVDGRERLRTMDPSLGNRATEVIAWWMLEAIRPFTDPQHAPVPGEHPLELSEYALGELGRILLESEVPDVALALATTGASIGVAWSSTSLVASESVLRVCRNIGDPSALAYAVAHHAMALLNQDPGRPGAELEAFDLLEEAIGLLHRSDQKGVLVGALSPLVNDDRFEVLVPLAALAAGVEMDHDLAMRLRYLIDPMWPEAFDPVVLEALSTAIEIEDARLALDPPSNDTVIHAEWSTWSFDHPAFRRAVPQGESLAKTVTPSTILQLAHEITHVHCMCGDLGRVNLALRHAALINELKLHLLEGDLPLPAPQALARVDGRQLTALLFSAQIVDATRKQQVLAAVWNPWLEGLAVFGELASDGRSDEFFSPTGEVVANLIDVDLGGRARNSQRTREAEFDLAIAEGEQRYADAISSEGHHQLRSYLVPRNFAKYGPGYFVVRAVVAAWRDRCPEGMTGLQAFRVLLHATRFGVDEVIPPLDLPLDTFREDAIDGLLDWIDNLARLPEETLLALQPGAGPHRWREGRLVPRTSLEEATAEVDRSHRARVESLIRHVPSAPELEAAADGDLTAFLRSLEREASSFDVPPDLLVTQFGLEMESSAMLPLASAEAPFWLTGGDHPTISLLVRSRERDATADRGGYSYLRIPIDTRDLDAIYQHLQDGGPRRLQVVRYADLMEASDDRGFGRNLLSFTYGSWLGVDARGLGLGTVPSADLEQAVRNRLLPDPLSAFARSIATGQAQAERTAAWLDLPLGAEWHDGDEPVLVDLSPWVAHVRSEASCVLDPDGSEIEGATGAAMVTRAFGPKVAPALTSFESLVGPASPAAAVRYLVASGVAAQGAPAPDGLHATVSTPTGNDFTPHLAYLMEDR